MPWNLYCVSVQENPRCDSIARRLSLRPVKSSGSVTLDGSRLSKIPCKLNASGYKRPLVTSVQAPEVRDAVCVARIDPDASATKSMRTFSKGATKTRAEDSAPCWSSPDKRYRP